MYFPTVLQCINRNLFFPAGFYYRNTLPLSKKLIQYSSMYQHFDNKQDQQLIGLKHLILTKFGKEIFVIFSQ